MSDIGICKFCKHIDKDIVEKPCLHCSANLGAFEFDLADHDKQIRDEVIIETLESVIKMIADWGYEDLSSVVLRENLKARIEQMKGEQNE